MKGFKVSHSDIKTRRFFKPNLHVLKVKFLDGEIKKVALCSKCHKKISNDFAVGKRQNFVPLSLLNHQRIMGKVAASKPEVKPGEVVNG
jgi:ribosomal protein L28